MSLCVCVCMIVMRGQGRSDEEGKEAFCGPSNSSALALFSQTCMLCTHTYIHIV